MNEQATMQEGVAVKTFREELVNGNFDAAKVIERENTIPPQAVRSVIVSVYDQFLATQQFVLAIDLAKKYELSKDQINDAIYMEFRRIVGTGDVDKAIEWAMVYNLPEYEITRAAIKGIEASILEGNIELAIEIKKKYHISEEAIGNVWQQGFDLAFQNGDFFNAALLSREFGMSERKTEITAAKAFRSAMRDVDFDRMILVENEFHLFNDNAFSLLGDDDGRQLIKMTEEFIKKHLRSENFQKTVEVILGLGILYKDIKNHTLRALWHYTYNQAREIHSMLLHENRYEDAIWFYREMSLFEENTPEKIKREVFEQAVSYHNQLMKDAKLSAAQKVKKDYDLLGSLSNHESVNSIQNSALTLLSTLIQKGETQTGNQIIKEYNIPQEELEEVVKVAVIEAMNKNDFIRGLDIIEKFNVSIDDYDVREAASQAFQYCKNNGYQETAADIGLLFQLDVSEVREVAVAVWESMMQNQNYKKATTLKRKFKLPKRLTENVAKSEYQRLVDLNDLDNAKKIRAEYKVNISILTMIVEWFKKLLMLFFKGDQTDAAALDIAKNGESSAVAE